MIKVKFSNIDHSIFCTKIREILKRNEVYIKDLENKVEILYNENKEILPKNCKNCNSLKSKKNLFHGENAFQMKIINQDNQLELSL
jgi:hypothetical protein